MGTTEGTKDKAPCQILRCVFWGSGKHCAGWAPVEGPPARPFLAGLTPAYL